MLKFNVNKTKVCVFETRRTKHNFEWFINNDTIEEVEKFSYLGVIFSTTGNLKLAVKALT